jgi:hypothetical protein
MVLYNMYNNVLLRKNALFESYNENLRFRYLFARVVTGDELWLFHGNLEPWKISCRGCLRDPPVQCMFYIATYSGLSIHDGVKHS